MTRFHAWWLPPKVKPDSVDATKLDYGVICPCGHPGFRRTCPDTKKACHCCGECFQDFCEWKAGDLAFK